MTAGTFIFDIILRHVTPGDLLQKTLIPHAVTPAFSPPFSLTISPLTPPRFHNDGRMLDVFQRLTAADGTYFLPHDLELSNQELSYVVRKAEQWRGFSGERRKVELACSDAP